MYKIKKSLAFVVFMTTIFLLVNCKKDAMPPPPETILPAGARSLEAYKQRETGDAQAGYDYLLNGNYVSSGIPIDIFKAVYTTGNDLGRTGDNKGIRYDFSASTTATGVKVVGANCLTCHAEKINGQLIVGVGNNTADYTKDLSSQFTGLELGIQLKYGKPSKEWSAYEPFGKSFKISAPLTITDCQGVNPADKVFAVLAAHRDAKTLVWNDVAQYNVPKEVAPTDVPAWWLMKKKNALYYNGLGVGDYVRMIMTTSMATLKDTVEARQIDKKFVDVLAYLKNITAPKYPLTINQPLADKGKILFEKNCSKCHGTYQANPKYDTYPNLLIDYKILGTDSYLAESYSQYPEFNTWFNKSWFGLNPNGAQLNPTKGYVAPPLDGVWATAPYFHNASVPSLEDVLNSTKRPTFWRRDFTNTKYDEVKGGWSYEALSKKEDIQTYNTTLRGYNNTGHTYGDFMSDDERKSVIEFLKTL
jgi:cytochrome c5